VVNFNGGDLAAWAAFTGAGVPVGFFAGVHSLVLLLITSIALPPVLLHTDRRLQPTALPAADNPLLRSKAVSTAVAIGSLAGFMYACQSSSGRLMGLVENGGEVKAAGGKKR
jgi:hypothetical protein